jgi:CheY-like chemotaxis protein
MQFAYSIMTKLPSLHMLTPREVVDWRGLTFLLVEDNVDHQWLMSAVLRDTRVKMSIVGRGEEAVAAVKASSDVAHAFDLVLMDMRLPTMDGYETTRELRALGYEGPIVAITARVMEEEIERCRRSGCDACIRKPFDKATLHDTLSGLLVGIGSDR